MNDEILLLGKQMNQMGEIFNTLPGEVFRIKDSETLLIIQRRMKESDLLNALCLFNEIFSKSEGAAIKDISQSAVAYIAIKILIENHSFDYNAMMKRQLIKEYKNQITKVNNIVYLSKVNAITAEAYQKEIIEKTLKKNEEFLEYFQNEIERLEKQIERLPNIENEPVDLEGHIAETTSTVKLKKVRKVHEMVTKVSGLFSVKKNQKETEDKLRKEEKNKSKTKCVEIPFYESRLVITESFVCKDIPAYSICKRKNNIYFGLTKNLEKGVYRNDDQSLLELTEVTEDFIQYMKVDILSGEYILKSFNNEEKRSLQIYFDFITSCFEKNIGITLTVQEYLQFKNYYNKVVLTMFELEEKFHRDYYRALILADNYIAYMKCYDLILGDEKKDIIKNIMNERGRNYIDDLELIIKHHVVNEKAKNVLQELIYRIQGFSDEQVLEEDNQDEKKDNDVYLQAKDYKTMTAVETEDSSYIQIKIQFQNKDYAIIDEAIFAVGNVKKAVYDYLKGDSYIKKIGVRMKEKDVFLYSSKNASLSVPILTEEIKRIKNLDAGMQGQIIAFYEDQIGKIMIELTQ